MRIEIQTVPHGRLRHSTTADCQWIQDTLRIRVSALADWRHSMLIAFHELVEALLCEAHGVPSETVDAWDIGPGQDMDEPGDDPEAPYHKEHVAAGRLERQLAHEFGVDWGAYEHAVDALSDGGRQNSQVQTEARLGAWEA